MARVSCLRALPVPDMLTGLIGAIGTMMAIRDHTKQGGSYHVFASLMAAASLHMKPEVGLYAPAVVQQCTEKFKWDEMGPDLFVLELLDVALKGWKDVMPAFFAKESQYTTRLQGDWGDFELLKPVVKLPSVEASPHHITAPEPNCYRASDAVSWL